jgi:molecular chaperone DnaJ
VSLSFEQAVEGAQVSLQVPMAQTCHTCRGTGAKPGTAPKVCPRCQGRGVESQGEGLFSISQPCSQCAGSGTVIEDKCATCAGSGSTKTVKRYKTNIPAGVKEAAACGWPARASRAATAARPATCSSSPTSPTRRCSRARATTSRSRSR